MNSVSSHNLSFEMFKGTVHLLKSKTITNQERIGCLVYPEITQISERSL